MEAPASISPSVDFHSSISFCAIAVEILNESVLSWHFVSYLSICPIFVINSVCSCCNSNENPMIDGMVVTRLSIFAQFINHSYDCNKSTLMQVIARTEVGHRE